MIDLKKKELELLARHGIEQSELLDCRPYCRRGRTSLKDLSTIGKKRGKSFLYHPDLPCRNCGNTIRTRTSGASCIECRPASISFMSRWREKGVVYVVTSEKLGLVKVGGSSGFEKRLSTINGSGYAGAKDWKLFHKEPAAQYGMTEYQAHLALSAFQVHGVKTVEGSRKEEATELFSCTPEQAKAVVIAVCTGGELPDLNQGGKVKRNGKANKTAKQREGESVLPPLMRMNTPVSKKAKPKAKNATESQKPEEQPKADLSLKRQPTYRAREARLAREAIEAKAVQPEPQVFTEKKPETPIRKQPEKKSGFIGIVITWLAIIAAISALRVLTAISKFPQ